MADSLASQIITAIGGPENVRSLTHCATRLRFELADASKVDQNALEHMKGVLGAVPQSGDRFQVVIGGGVATVYENIMHLPEMANAGAASASGEGQKSNADVKAEAARKAEERLKYMTFYSTTQDCLRGFLLHYFGEAAPKKCGNCSCCLAAEQEAQLQVEYSRRRAADNARRLEMQQYEKGKNNKLRQQQEIFAEYRRKNLVNVMLNDSDEKLLGKLFEVRKRLAAKQRVPAFNIFSDAVLREMAQKKPRDMDELIRINGVGEHPAMMYGKDFLRVIIREVGSRE